eukprot:gene16091-18168_t
MIPAYGYALMPKGEVRKLREENTRKCRDDINACCTKIQKCNITMARLLKQIRPNTRTAVIDHVTAALASLCVRRLSTNSKFKYRRHLVIVPFRFHPILSYCSMLL